MKLSNIYYHDEYGNTDLVATTNNVDKWLKSSNEDRIRDGHDAESLDDFIEETSLKTLTNSFSIFSSGLLFVVLPILVPSINK